MKKLTFIYKEDDSDKIVGTFAIKMNEYPLKTYDETYELLCSLEDDVWDKNELTTKFPAKDKYDRTIKYTYSVVVEEV